MEEHISFLVSDTGRLIRKAFDERAKAMGITRPQWRVLSRLKLFPGIRQNLLADHLEVEAITLSRMIDRLEQSGLVERRAHPDDRRAKCLYLKAKAEPLLDQMRQLVTNLHSDLLAGFSSTEADALRSALLKMRGNLDELVAINRGEHSND